MKKYKTLEELLPITHLSDLEKQSIATNPKIKLSPQDKQLWLHLISKPSHFG